MTEEATTLYVMAGKLGLEPKVLGEMIKLGHAKSPLMQTALTMMQTGEKPPVQCLADWLLIACTELERVKDLATQMSMNQPPVPMFIPIEDTALGRTLREQVSRTRCRWCREVIREFRPPGERCSMRAQVACKPPGDCKNCDGLGYLVHVQAALPRVHDMPGKGSRAVCEGCEGTGDASKPCVKCDGPRDAAVHNAEYMQGHGISGHHPYTDTRDREPLPSPLGRPCPKCLKPIENLVGKCPYAKTGTCTSHWFAQQEANRVTMNRANCKTCGGSGAVSLPGGGPGEFVGPCGECA